jgi:hypothetical protein
MIVRKLPLFLFSGSRFDVTGVGQNLVSPTRHNSAPPALSQESGHGGQKSPDPCTNFSPLPAAAASSLLADPHPQCPAQQPPLPGVPNQPTTTSSYLADPAHAEAANAAPTGSLRAGKDGKSDPKSSDPASGRETHFFTAKTAPPVRVSF